MSINRLRHILQSNLQVQIDSSPAVVAGVQTRIAARVQELAEKSETIEIKTPATVPTLQSVMSFNLRPIDLLRKIGQLTTPSSLNIARFSASWATRRYFWAIEPGTGLFRLSRDARQLDFHQKTLLSDEFGIGMAGLVMETYFQADGFSDVSAALADPTFGLQHEGDPEPDYLMWSGSTGAYFVVECKGCQTSRSTALNQIRRGMEQLPTVTFKDTNRTMVSLVIATVLENTSTTVIVLDPPDDEREFRGENISERVSQRKWEIASQQKLLDRVLNVQRSYLLKWSGQNQAAAQIDEHLEVQRIASQDLANAVPEVRGIGGERFVGYRSALFPELFEGRVTVFSGAQNNLVDAARGGSVEMQQALQQFRTSPSFTHPIDSPYASIGVDGTCLQVEGV